MNSDDIEEIVDSEEEDDIQVPEDDEVNSGKGKGVVISYSDETIKTHVPDRSEFAKNSECYEEVRKDIMDGEPVAFLPIDIDDCALHNWGSALRIYGIVADGSKAEILIPFPDGVFFDIRLKRRVVNKVHVTDESITDSIILMHLEMNDMKPLKSQLVYAFPWKGVYDKPQPYLRVWYKTNKQRKNAILYVVESEFETASDDTSCHYRKFAREKGISISSWMVLRRYSFLGKSKHCEYAFEVYESGIEPCGTTEKAILNAGSSVLLKDKTMVLAWDIETYSARKTGDSLPLAHHVEDNAFMICLTAHWKDNSDSLVRIAIVDKPTDPDERWLTIVCSSYREVIKAFFDCWSRLKPDIVIGFNDSQYDWPFIIQKIRYYGLMAFVSDKISAAPAKSSKIIAAASARSETSGFDDYNVRKSTIKISSDEVFTCEYLKFPGYLPIDVRVPFKKLYPRGGSNKASSLKFYLSINGLPSKADMPILKMWNLYERSDPEGMRQIAHYCVVDAMRCQQLMVRRQVINDYREVSAIAYVSTFDSHCCAGGMKVCNLLTAYAVRKNILTSLYRDKKEKEKSKYPGAYVFPPEKGIVPNPIKISTLEDAIRSENTAAIKAAIEDLDHDRPVTGLDFSSLYPSIIMAYNLSPEKIVLPEDDVDISGKRVHQINFIYNGAVVKGCSIMYEKNDYTVGFGLFPTVLKYLFDKRKEVKSIMEKFGKIKEMIEQSMNENADLRVALHRLKEKIKCPLKQKIIDNILEHQDISSYYDDVCFRWSCASSKQYAIKIYMNSFYGESGNKLSPFYLLQLAGGVTSAGQETLKQVSEFVGKKRFIVKYGDTDSLYLVSPRQYFTECDELFVSGKIDKKEWYTQMVYNTMKTMESLKDEVNVFLEEKTSGPFLKMAYEEVLYPVAFTGKKKYFGTPHVSEVNFNNKTFIKGIDIIKQGQSKMSITLGEQIMKHALDIANKHNIIDIIKSTIEDAVVNHAQWNLDDFIKSATYKLNKKNISVRMFVDRMKVVREHIHPKYLKLYELPENGERFNYILVKRDVEFDEYGRKMKISTSHKMEFVDVVKTRELGYQPDTAYYMSNYVVGLCARFINGEDQFQPANAHTLDEKKIDEEAQKNAKKFLSNYVKSISGESKFKTSDMSKMHKDAREKMRNIMKESLGSYRTQLIEDLYDTHNRNLIMAKGMTETFQEIYEKIDNVAKEYIKNDPPELTELIVKTINKNILGCPKAHGYNLKSDVFKQLLRNCLEQMYILFEKYRTNLTNSVRVVQTGAQLTELCVKFTEKDVTQLDKFNQTMMTLIGLRIAYERQYYCYKKSRG